MKAGRQPSRWELVRPICDDNGNINGINNQDKEDGTERGEGIDYDTDEQGVQWWKPRAEGEEGEEEEDRTFQRWWNNEGEEAGEPQVMEKGEDDENEEGRKPKRIVGPVQVTKEERDEHELTQVMV